MTAKPASPALTLRQKLIKAAYEFESAAVERERAYALGPYTTACEANEEYHRLNSALCALLNQVTT